VEDAGGVERRDEAEEMEDNGDVNECC